MDYKFRNKNGITLIALVVTIIILLILAGIGIAMLTGENLTLKQVANAKNQNKIATFKENIGLAYTAAFINNNINEQNMCELIKRELIQTYNNSNIVVKEYKDKCFYIEIENIGVCTIDNNGNINLRENAYNFAEDVLKEGDYVCYTDGNQNKYICNVLYDSSSEYGLQIITKNTLGPITLGYNDEKVNDELANNLTFSLNNVIVDENFKKSVYSYNNAIETLNEKALDYINPQLAYDARCVGSSSVNKNKENEYSVISVKSTNDLNEEWSFSGDFKTEDNNYKTDVEQMRKLNILGSDHKYFLCSRKTRIYSYGFSFGVRIVRYRDNTWEDYYCYFVQDNKGNPIGENYTVYFRPVFILSGAIIGSGDGDSEETAYVLKHID